MDYGYGHTKEAAAIVRKALNEALKAEKKLYGLKISVKKGGGYGGPRVDISTHDENFAHYYEYIVDENGKPAYSGKLVRTRTRDIKVGYHPSMKKLAAKDINTIAKAVEDKIEKALSGFGRDNDDAMTDYFDNTQPLYYGVDFKEAHHEL